MRAIVNYVTSNGWYPRGQARLIESIARTGCGITLLTGREGDGNARPSHQDVPYGFKTAELQRARFYGVGTALWLDASMWAIQDPTPIFEHAERHGAALWDCGFKLGEWCHDRGLNELCLTRDEAMNIPLVIGGCVCICFDHPAGAQLIDRWDAYSRDGVSFQGSWDNAGQSCSRDPRCKGHRHDMPSLSELANCLRLPLLERPKWFDYWSETPSPETLIVARGM
jgi:hypothetical protein